MGTSETAWARRPSGDGGKFIPIFRAPERGVLRVVSVCPDLCGVWVHWEDGRTAPCRGGKPTCHYCVAKHGRKWLGYLGIWEPTFDRVGVLEITGEAYRNCPELENEILPDLRGYHLNVTRAKPHKHARVIVEFAGQVDPEVQLPSAFDVQAALERIWAGAMSRQEGTRE